MSEALDRPNPARPLTQWTTARVDLGRVGTAMPTGAMLEFTLDHALARDAVHTPLDTRQLAFDLEASGFPSRHVWSNARSRPDYLRRPDLGRSLAPECEPLLHRNSALPPHGLAVVLADGLSATATARHALPLLQALCTDLSDWTLTDVLIATQARVALGDHIGELLRAEAVLVLIGERPGLKSTDSLGGYLTYRPHIGRTDAERNCVSNIRPAGLSYPQAAHTLRHLLRGARALGLSGVLLKDNSSAEPLTPNTASPVGLPTG